MPDPASVHIRTATSSDLPQIVDIYNQAIAEGNCTADTHSLTVEERQDWFDSHNPDKYPIYVMEKEGEILGWCSLSAHRRGRMALSNVAEISYYVDQNHRKKGIGRQLMQHALEQASKLGLHNLFAILLDVNKTSVALLEKNGFARWGHLPDIAEFPDKTCGQFIYGRKV